MSDLEEVEKIINRFSPMDNFEIKEQCAKAICEHFTPADSALIEPLVEVYEKYKGVFKLRIARQEISLIDEEAWNAIKTVVEAHRNSNRR